MQLSISEEEKIKELREKLYINMCSQANGDIDFTQAFMLAHNAAVEFIKHSNNVNSVES